MATAGVDAADSAASPEHVANKMGLTGRQTSEPVAADSEVSASDTLVVASENKTCAVRMLIDGVVAAEEQPVHWVVIIVLTSDTSYRIVES